MQNLEPPEVPLELDNNLQGNTQDMPLQENMFSQDSQDNITLQGAMQLPPLTELSQKEQKPKKEGFFKRLFSKKEKQEEAPAKDIQTLPDMELPQMDGLMDFGMTGNRQDSGLPELPGVDEQLAELEKNIDVLENENIPASDNLVSKKGKSKGKAKKGQKRDIKKIDESSQFDWTREIQDQEILIHNSNRFNQDINMLMKDADAHVEDKSQLTKAAVLSSEPHEVDTFVAPIAIDDMGPLTELPEEEDNPMIIADPKQHADFVKISMTHKKLRGMLNKHLKDKKVIFPNKSKLVNLIRMYDEDVERYIEDKELELNKIKKDIKRRESQLRVQEQEVRDMHLYVKDLDEKLKKREADINDTFNKNVERELTRRLKDEKAFLKSELQKTVALNNDLKKKVKIVEDDRVRFENEHRQMSESERKKLNELQLIYEKKIRDADMERKDFEEKKHAFEERRKVSLDLLKLADTLSKELKDVKEMKEYVDANKNKMDKDLAEDRELKLAIDNAQKSLVEEKENLDSMIFSRYIENKLRSIKPEYLEKKEDWKAEYQSNPLYGQIVNCRKLLAQHNMTEAKALYNNIRKAYDQVHVTRKEKEALYTAIRELYNEIQLKVVELQMHEK